MQRFSAFDLQRKTGSVQDAALREPVSITHHGRDRLVLMSAEEYARLKARDRLSLAVEELPDDLVAALAEPYHDDDQAALDRLLDDDA